MSVAPIAKVRIGRVQRVPVVRVISEGTPTPAEIGAYDKAEIDTKVASLETDLDQKVAVLEEYYESVREQVAEQYFDFYTPSLQWVIPHNLGRKYPSVRILDTAGEEIMTDIVAQDANTAIATFAAPTAGTAFVN